LASRKLGVSDPREPGHEWRLTTAVALIVLLAVPPFLGSYYHYVASLALINIIVAIGLNLLTGNAGQISLCQSSFMAIGAYAATYLSTTLGVSYWLALPAAGCLAGFCGLVLGVPALRLQGFYLAVVTLGFLELTQFLVEQIPSITGGVRGLASPRPAIAGLKLSRDLHFYYVVLGVALLLGWIAHSLLMSPMGRAFNAIRNSPSAAQALGIPLAATKLTAFVIAAFYAGVGGGLFAPLVGFIDPGEFGVGTSVRHVVFIVVGGLGSIAGAVGGAVVLTALPELLRSAKEYNDLIFGGLLLLVLMLFPGGLVGFWPALRSRSKSLLQKAHWHRKAKGSA
jgi:branched-chain amino acid transport system permease protein